MIAGIHISQKTFAIDMLTALKPSLEDDRKHVVPLLRPGFYLGFFVWGEVDPEKNS